MSYQSILYKIENGVAFLTLNRPESFNAFNETMSFEVIDAIKKSAKDESVRCLVITGAGEKAFCSGQDLKDAQGKTRSLSDSVKKRYNPMILGIREMNKPVIARVNGVAAGAGASLAFACDYIIAAEHVYFMQAFVKIGLVPDSGSSWFLPQNIGYQKAFELCTIGDKINAAQAKELGLVNQVVKPEELDDAVNKIASYYSSAPTKAIGLIKKMLNKAMTSNLEDALQLEAYSQEIAGRSEDYKEGVQAFVEKRPANFTGK